MWTCSPYSRVRAGDLEADLLDDSVHYFISGLNGWMNDHLDLHQTKKRGVIRSIRSLLILLLYSINDGFYMFVNVMWTHFFGDPILYDGGLVNLQQAFSRQAVDETKNGLLAALWADSIQLLLIIDHLLKPGERHRQWWLFCSLSYWTIQLKMEEKRKLTGKNPLRLWGCAQPQRSGSSSLGGDMSRETSPRTFWFFYSETPASIRERREVKLILLT